jgi:hypothetical protein
LDGVWRGNLEQNGFLWDSWLTCSCPIKASAMRFSSFLRKTFNQRTCEQQSFSIKL